MKEFKEIGIRDKSLNDAEILKNSTAFAGLIGF